MQELVSVIVPVYNIEAYLPRCLACIKEQTYSNLEIILVDDGSTDGSGRLCDEFAASDSRACVIHHPKNQGAWAARNTGQNAASGEYLWFPDGDDFFHKDIVKLMYQAINRNGMDYDIALVKFQKVDSLEFDIQSYGVLSYFEVTQEELIDSLFHHHNKGRILYCTLWNKLFRQRLINDIRSMPYERAEDWDFTLKVYLKTHKGIAIDNVLYYWVQRPDSLMHMPNHYISRVRSKIQIYYDNIIQLPSGMSKYGNVLLYFLYKQVNEYQRLMYTTDSWIDTMKLIKPIVKDTRCAYLRCQECSMLERLFRLWMADCPKITPFMVLLRNKLLVRKVFK